MLTSYDAKCRKGQNIDTGRDLDKTHLCALQSALIRQQRCLFETHEVVSEVYQPIRFKATILEFVMEGESCFINPQLMSQNIPLQSFYS